MTHDVPYTVLLIGGARLMRQGLCALIDQERDFNVIGSADDFEDGLTAAQATSPRLVIVDLGQPSPKSAAHINALTATSSARVVLLIDGVCGEDLGAHLRAGASGFLVKDSEPTATTNALRAVADGHTLFSMQIGRSFATKELQRSLPENSRAALDNAADLTTRERDVLIQLGKGLNNAEIAASMHLGESTVKTYVSNILTKLDLRDRTQAAIYAVEAGLHRQPLSLSAD